VRCAFEYTRDAGTAINNEFTVISTTTNDDEQPICRVAKERFLVQLSRVRKWERTRRRRRRSGKGKANVHGVDFVRSHESTTTTTSSTT
jgi:hypothetical protein